MLNMKKALTAAVVLTALCATAFAADVQEQTKPSVRQRVNCILNEDGGQTPCPPAGDCRGSRMRLHHNPHNGYRQHHGDYRRGPEDCPQLTAEEREAREKLRAEWESMTPEERREAWEKWHQERRENCEKHAREAMARLTPEQQAEVEAFIRENTAQRQERRSKLQKMTPEQRRAVCWNYCLQAKEAARN